MTLSISEGHTKMILDSLGGKAEVYVPVGNGSKVTLVEGQAAYIETRTAFGAEYAVFEITDAGQFIFQSE